MKFYKKVFFISLFIFFLTPFVCFAGQQKKLLIKVFHMPHCGACVKTIHDVIPPIAKEFKDRVIWEYVDIDNSENYKIFLRLEQLSGRDLGTPVLLVGNKILVGLAEAADSLKSSIVEALKTPQEPLSLDPAGIDLLKRFKSFGLFAIIFAGLIDGVNPCAFTVIIFFISFLTLMGYKRKELILISTAYILAVFSTYLALGFGFFKVLYSLKVFYVISRIVYLVIGGLSIFLGFLAFRDYIIYKKTRQTDGMILQLPRVIKNKIHQVVGAYYRKDKGGKDKSVWGLFVSALAVGFLVSLLEAVCTGQLYVPTIMYVLKEGSLRARALLYLVIYNVMFIVPLLIVFLLALMGVTSKQFEAFTLRRLGLIKIAMAAVFFALGTALLLGR